MKGQQGEDKLDEIKDAKSVINFIIEKLLQWIYATRNKKSIHKILATLVVASTFIVGISLFLYIIEMLVLTYRHIDI